MGRRFALNLCIIGVLVFTSLVQAQEIHGTPGVDYPNYFTIPETSFKCSDQKYNPGFYADLETKCQAFHFCYQDRQESFLCPTGTIFNQAVLTCDVWYKSNCSVAQMFYGVNAGPIMERAGKNLPMLLRLRNRSQNKPSAQTSTANSFDKVSSLHETDNETPSDLSTSKDTQMKIQNYKSTDSQKDFDEKDNEQMVSDSREGLHAERDLGEAGDKNEFSNEIEEGDSDLVYEPVNEYGNYDQYENEYQDAEPVSEEFGRFYDYKDTDDRYGVQTKELQLNDYAEDESFEDTDLTVVDDSDYPEFTKRSSHTGHSKRRKPVYVVLDDQPEVETTGTNEESDSPTKSEREAKEISFSSEETTPSPDPFPRPTAIPHHLLNISTDVPMTSEEFETAILDELVSPQLPDDYGVVLASTYPQDNQNTSQSEQTGSQMSDAQSDDETIYIEDDLEPESFVPYDQQYEEVIVVPETGERYVSSYAEPQDQPETSSDTDDTFVVIPDEYDNAVDPNENLSDYPDDTVYRTQMLADPPTAEYGSYENYQYPSSYPQYVQTDYDPEVNEEYQNYVPNDQRYAYETDYEVPEEQYANYGNPQFDSAYVDPDSNSYETSPLEVTERPLELPVTEADLDKLSEELNEIDSEEDLVQGPEVHGQSEDVYYILDEDANEQSNESNETKTSEDESIGFNEPSEKSSEPVETKSDVESESMKSENDASSSSLDKESDPEPIDTDVVNEYSSNSAIASQNEQPKPLDDVKAVNPKNPLSGTNTGFSQMPAEHQNSASLKTTSSNMANFDFSTDSRFLNNMGYSESMDFGPYGFGPNMGQFSMMESMQPSTAGNFFAQRTSQTEPPKLSPLSAIQEKMRSMKQGKFGAFKKYMSSTN